ncbi:succinate dehydrogenase, cytochrome b556 subunit [Deinococcus pimensis]|uniref:succinate dehydrogenase, cytochrome b556 subunit n=1 Tax=Deinococcus pimensis TaxID=309888 RepID=UPI0004851CD7|nr:succinate dehydrogenase, cytochrome b556 subunit [Deinococcus pimensis]
MYRGREGQWAWLLHRLSGLAILAYLMLHIVSIGSMIFGEEVYMSIHEIYDLALFRLGLIAVVGGVLYHSLNGLRVILLDMTGRGIVYQRQLFYATLVLTLAGMAFTAYKVIPRVLGGY